MPICMKLSLNNIIAFLVFPFLVVSCVDSSPFFGNNMVPPDQQMNTKIDSSIGIKTYTISMDSMATSNLGAVMYVGRYDDAMVGRTFSQLACNYAPYGYKDEEAFKHGFGKDPRIDSLVLETNVEWYRGDSTKKSKLEIFRITKFNFHYDSLYYSNFNVDPYIDPTPLLSLDLTGNKEIKAKLPLAYAKEHFDDRTSEESIYFDALKFHERFNGFYFKVTPYQDEGALYRIDLQQTFMFLYYNNKDDAERPDTVLSHSMYFYNSDIAEYNTTVQMFQHDYSKSDQSIGGINPATINDTLTPQKRVYTSGMAGLGALIEFSEEDIQRFIEKAKIETDAGIGVHRAYIEWKKEDKSWENMNSSFTALGLYYNIDKYKFIPGYNPLLERSTVSSGQYKNTFGLLNRSQGIYTMDITQYVQRMVRGDKVYNKLQLFPHFFEATDPAQSVVWSNLAEDEKLRPYLVIVYTLVK